MKILVTGGAGYVGSHAIRSLARMGTASTCTTIYPLATGFLLIASN